MLMSRRNRLVEPSAAFGVFQSDRGRPYLGRILNFRQIQQRDLRTRECSEVCLEVAGGPRV